MTETRTIHSWQDWLIVIPARIGSTRLARKPLADLKGKPLIVRVYERAAPLAKEGATIVVATDDAEIMSVLTAHGIKGVMTDPEHPSGTDRVLEAAGGTHHPYIMNVQGDEPFIVATDLQRLAQAASAQKNFMMGTLLYRSKDQSDYLNPNIVKCVRSDDQNALYFSRSPIPCFRDGFQGSAGFWHHLGIYAFSRPTLEKFCALPPSSLELAERLEQLRALENGIPILTIEAEHRAVGIDTAEDLLAANARY